MVRPVFRFAPSPNGQLHLGHAYSALLNEWAAKQMHGRLLLRIEDTDRSRCRPEHVQQIFADLHWLGLSWEEPVRMQSEHLEDYRANIEALWKEGFVYPCFCSRKTARPHPGGRKDPDGNVHYAGTCRNLPQAEALARIDERRPHGWRMNIEACGQSDAALWGDVVIARFINGSSYHIAVVTDDAIQGITHVIRGTDMEPATSIHRLLQRLLGYPSPAYFHHKLILDDHGQKLSKSLNSTSLAHLRASGLSAAEVRDRLGFGNNQKSLAMPLFSQSP